jgi:phage-related minor tail protein
MADEIETLLIGVRADTNLFARDVAAMKAELSGPFEAGVDRAGRALENALVRALRTGKLGFEDLKRVALSAMAEIASVAIRAGIGAIFGGGGKSAGGGGLGGLVGDLSGLIAGLLGAPGKAIGGPVSPGRPYLVGERGPELFVPTAGGRIETGRAAGGLDIRLSIHVNAPAGSEAQALRASSRQVARAVRQALLRADD